MSHSHNHCHNHEGCCNHDTKNKIEIVKLVIAVILFILATLFGITVSLYLYIRDIMYILKKNIYVKKEAKKIDEENAIIQTRYIDSLIDDLKTKVGVDKNEGRFKKDHK